MRNEVTKASRSSQQIAIVRRNRDSILPISEILTPLVPEGPVEEGTSAERARAAEYWFSTSHEAVRR